MESDWDSDSDSDSARIGVGSWTRVARRGLGVGFGGNARMHFRLGRYSSKIHGKTRKSYQHTPGVGASIYQRVPHLFWKLVSIPNQNCCVLQPSQTPQVGAHRHCFLLQLARHGVLRQALRCTWCFGALTRDGHDHIFYILRFLYLYCNIIDLCLTIIKAKSACKTLINKHKQHLKKCKQNAGHLGQSAVDIQKNRHTFGFSTILE